MREVRQSESKQAEGRQAEDKQAEDWLPEALRELGATSARQAPLHVGVALKSAFARHHAARQRTQRLRVSMAGAAMAAMLLLSAGIALFMRGPQTGRPIARQPVAPVHPAAAIRLGTALATTASKDAVITFSRPHPRLSRADVASRSFTAMPSYDPHMTNHEDLRVVRLQLSSEALRRVGIRVQEENAERLMLADFVVGQDGTPYAFRLVATQVSQ
ncbi:MAG TPA: hypothetical protein VNW97_14290 [Candidatus Saccharimonadales bacterium]|jgi:hypothetical protein|nr:hypothetical protein [Candidatus Saccharimonadales bacterium]